MINLKYFSNQLAVNFHLRITFERFRIRQRFCTFWKDNREWNIMHIKFSKNFQIRRRKTKKKKFSFLSSNAITTIFGLEKLQSLLMSSVKKFFEKNNSVERYWTRKEARQAFSQQSNFSIFLKNPGVSKFLIV